MHICLVPRKLNEKYQTTLQIENVFEKLYRPDHDKMCLCINYSVNAYGNASSFKDK